MRAQNSAIYPAGEAIPRIAAGQGVLQAWNKLRAGSRKFWADQLLLQERLLVSMRPWEREGAACWKLEIGGWRLVGSALPDPEADDNHDSKDSS
jgi:hypothetical protein